VVTWQSPSENTVALRGELSQRSVESLLPVAPRLRVYDKELNIELSQLAKVDSAGLAFLIELQEYATQHDIALTFSGLTSALEKLVSLYNAQDLLIN